MTDTDPDTAAFNARTRAMAAFVQARCDEDQLWAVEAISEGRGLARETGDDAPEATA